MLSENGKNLPILVTLPDAQPESRRKQPDLMIVCPICGLDYVHLTGTAVIDGQDNYKAGWGGRGDLCRVSFWCENGHVWNLCFGFHKGNLFGFYQYEPTPTPETIALAQALDYHPDRRYENRAGYEAITPAQKGYILRLGEQYADLNTALTQLIHGYWGLFRLEQWSKADAMFVLARLLEMKKGVRDWSNVYPFALAAAEAEKKAARLLWDEEDEVPEDYDPHETDGGYTPYDPTESS